KLTQLRPSEMGLDKLPEILKLLPRAHEQAQQVSYLYRFMPKTVQNDVESRLQTMKKVSESVRLIEELGTASRTLTELWEKPRTYELLGRELALIEQVGQGAEQLKLILPVLSATQRSQLETTLDFYKELGTHLAKYKAATEAIGQGPADAEARKAALLQEFARDAAAAHRAALGQQGQRIGEEALGILSLPWGRYMHRNAQDLARRAISTKPDCSPAWAALTLALSVRYADEATPENLKALREARQQAAQHSQETYYGERACFLAYQAEAAHTQGLEDAVRIELYEAALRHAEKAFDLPKPEKPRLPEWTETWGHSFFTSLWSSDRARDSARQWAECCSALAKLYSVRGESEKAKAVFENGLRRKPGHPKLVRGYAAWLADVAKDRERARALFEDAAKEHGRKAALLLEYGDWLMSINAPEQAAEVWTSVQDQDEDWYNVAYALARAGKEWCGRQQWDKAIAVSERALRVLPDYFGPFENLIHAHIGRKDHDRALALIRQAYQKRPQYASAILALEAKAHFERGDYESAKRL
ncbi:MAG: tetratricopeptide repeat protein, partial [Planctomycetes bacterium]|nr:tetratricopeptide repeat protein [Planctomycetota bacterium]